MPESMTRTSRPPRVSHRPGKVATVAVGTPRDPPRLVGSSTGRAASCAPGGPLDASCRYRWLVLYRATELIAYPLLRAYFRPEVHGVEHVPRTGAAILAANHLSAADEVFTPVAARRQVV